MATLSAPVSRSRGERFWGALVRFDWWLLFASGFLMLVGLMSLYSIDHGTGSDHFKKQLFRVGVGIVPFFVMLLVRPEAWRRIWPLLYAVNLALLAMVIFVGKTKGGATRWVQMGPLEFQPSELAKLLIILTLAAFYYSRREEVNRLSTFLLGFAHVAVPMVLIYKQPHLGATLVVLTIWLAVSLAAKVPVRFVIGAVLFSIAGLTAAFFIPGALDDYQKERVLGLINPDAKDTGFQIDRALVAFGAGGLLGTGFLKGEVKAGGFVPEQETDLIFTVIGEEGGLLGCLLVLGVFGILFGRLWWIMFRAKELYHQMLIAGILAIFLAHTFANLGMVVRLTPVVGLWLPFMSFGGTSLWLCMAAVALALNIKQREDQGEMFAGSGLSRLG